jgi:hypothetical protein
MLFFGSAMVCVPVSPRHQKTARIMAIVGYDLCNDPCNKAILKISSRHSSSHGTQLQVDCASFQESAFPRNQCDVFVSPIMQSGQLVSQQTS